MAVRKSIFPPITFKGEIKIVNFDTVELPNGELSIQLKQILGELSNFQAPPPITKIPEEFTFPIEKLIQSFVAPSV